MSSYDEASSRWPKKALLVIFVILAIVLALNFMLRRRRSVTLSPLNSSEIAMRERLRRDVTTLANDIGERNTHHPEELARSVQFLDSTLGALGYEVKHQPYVSDGQTVTNVEAEIAGSSQPEEILIFGAHYDSVIGTPGANDNGSGVASVLELARAARGRKFTRTVRFVFFVNEEPPVFSRPSNG